MTVSSQQSSVRYQTDGTTTDFPVPFYFIANAHLVVTIGNDWFIETLTLGSDYGVSGAGQQSGGTLTLTWPREAGLSLFIERRPPFTQETAYQRNDAFPERAHERALDKLTMLTQNLRAAFDRSIQFPIEFPMRGNTLPRAALRARKAVIFDDLGNVTVGEDDYEDQVENVAASAAAAAQSATQANDARNEVVRIADQFGDVETAVGRAETAANSASTDAANAQVDANRAVAAANVASLQAGIYPNPAVMITGDANFPPVQNWHYASVPSPQGNGYLDLYQRRDGAAAYIDTYPNKAAIDQVIARLQELDYRTGQISRYPVPGYAKADVQPNGDGTGSVVAGITDKGVSVMAKAEVFDDLWAAGIPMQAPIIPGWSYYKTGKPDSSGMAPLLGYVTNTGAVYKYLLGGAGLTKISDPADIASLNVRVAALEGGGGGGGGGASGFASLGRLADALDNPLIDVNITGIGDSIKWGRTLPGQVYEPPARRWLLADKRDVLTTPSWMNLLRNWLGHTFLNKDNSTGPELEDAPGAMPGDGGSGYFSEVRVADARSARHMVLRDASGTQVARTGSAVTGAYTPAPLSIPPNYELEFKTFGADFDLLYGTAASGGNFEVFVDGLSAATQSFAGAASWSNVLSIPTSNAGHTVRVVNRAGVPLRLEAVRRTKIIRVVNQGIIGINTVTYGVGTSNLQNCLRPDSNFCIVALGTNDRHRPELPMNDTALPYRLSGIVENLMSRGQDVIMLSNGATTDDYPWNTGGTNRYMSMGDVARINREIALKYGLSHIDIYTLTRQLLLDGQSSIYLADGLHPNAVGHRDYWFAEVKRRILAAWEAL